MKSTKKAFLYGLGVWVIPFVVAIIIFPFRESERPLFESIMPVALGLAVVLFTYLYFKVVDVNFIKEGILIGIVWFAISVVIDLLIFSWGPMKMAFVDYVKDIGLTYLIIPTITLGVGMILWNKEKLKQGTS